MNWYYEQGGNRQGPIPESELDRLMANGSIDQDTLVWCEGMTDWAPLKTARAAGGGAPGAVPEGWIRCTATGRYFPPDQIVYLDGKPYSAEAKPAVLQGVMQSGALPSGSELERTGPPWEQREQLGFFKAAWETFKGVLTEPSATFQNMKREGGIGTPLAYYVIFGSIGSAIGLIYQLVFNVGTQSFLPPEAQQGSPALLAGMGVGFVIGVIIVLPVLMAIGAFFGAGILHLSLMICGGAKQPFETTMRTYCYAGGAANMLQVVPFCGALVSGVWSLVCLCIGISKTHEIATGRAVLAVLLPAIVCCVTIFFIFAAIMSAVFAAQGMK